MHMTSTKWRGIALLVAVGTAATLTAGCDSSSSSPTNPTLPAFQAAANPGSGVSAVLNTATIDAMNATIQDEYHAEFVYLKVVDTFGEVQPFYNILFAEQRHSEAIAKLFTSHGLAVPPSRWNPGNVPVFASLTEACAAAATAELENIALYDALLTRDLPRDVRNVFANLRAASLENHLPAFQTCCACSQ